MPACPRSFGVLGVVAVLVAATACGAPTGPEPPSEIGDIDTSAEQGADPQQPDLPAGSLEIPPEEVDTLYHSSVSGIVEARRTVIRSDDAWASTWAEVVGIIAPAPKLPEVDFASHQVLLLAMGEKPAGGYRIDVGALTYDTDDLTVLVRETSPGSGCVTTLALTQPVIVVRIPRVADDVTFVEESARYDCS